LCQGLLGDRDSGRPALAGGQIETLAQAAELRAEIVSLWSGAFGGDDGEAGCPAMPSNNSADPADTPSPAMVETLTLYIVDERGGSSSEANLTNRNSADSAALALDVLWAHAATLDDKGQGQGQRLLGSGMRRHAATAVVTQARAAVNTFFGQFADCHRNTSDTEAAGYACAADWECWCDGGWGPPPPPGQNPCTHDSDDDNGDPCMCELWGGCGGGQWGPAVADHTLTVGRRSLRKAAATAAAATTSPAAHADDDQLAQQRLVQQQLRHAAKQAHEFSTTEGGECVAGKVHASPFGEDICTWAPLGGPADWARADAACLERAVVAAAAEAASAAECWGLGAQQQPLWWLECALTPAAMRAATHAVESAFLPGSTCLLSM
jgi:hypothetical protein